MLGGRRAHEDRFAGDTTRYVIEKAPCRVILTAPPADAAPEPQPEPLRSPADPTRSTAYAALLCATCSC